MAMVRDNLGKFVKYIGVRPTRGKCRICKIEKEFIFGGKRGHICKECYQHQYLGYSSQLYVKERRRIYAKNYRQQNRDKLKAKWLNAYLNNRSAYIAKRNEYYYKNKEKVLARLSHTTRLRSELEKAIVFKHYGGERPKCAFCGETDYMKLTIDHIDNDGKKHRRELPNSATGRNFYHHLIKNNFPRGIQILCASCNMKKETSRRGYVPEYSFLQQSLASLIEKHKLRQLRKLGDLK